MQAIDPQDLIGQSVVGNGGAKLGKVNNVLLDQATGQVEFASVRTGLFGMRESIVPLTQAASGPDGLVVPYDEQQIKDAPNFDADHALSQEEERALYTHYGFSYSEADSPTGLPATDGGTASGRDVSGPTTDNAMTRSEERLHVGKETLRDRPRSPA